MANKQPWYHEVQLLYTTTHGRCLTANQAAKILDLINGFKGVVKNSAEVLDSEPEPGDPADLM